MSCRFLVSLSALALAACVSKTSHVTGVPHSIATNPRMPLGDMEAFIAPEEWHRLRDLEYVRYAMMSATIKADGSVIVGKVTESSPDASWNQLAQSFGKEVILRVNATTSMLNKRGEIYVVFFKSEIRGNLVLIFGRQIDEPPFPFDGGRTVFRGRQIGTPNIETSHRPKYVRTFVYY